MGITFMRTEDWFGSKKRFLYRISGDIATYCEKLFSLNTFNIDEVRVTIHGEEMEPDTSEYISSFAEYTTIMEKQDISRCTFYGKYDNKTISICVDHGLSRISITEEEGLVREIIQALDN